MIKKIILKLMFIFLLSISASAKPLKIVSLAPNLTEIVYALGLGKNLVGSTLQCDYPLQAQKNFKIGDYNNPSVEKILQSQADVVLATEGNPLAIVKKLKNFGVQVIEFNPQSVEELPSSIEKIAFQLGVPDKGREIAKSIRLEMNRLEKQKVSRGSFLIVLADNPIYSASNKTWIGSLFSLTGLNNIVGMSRIKYPTVSREYLVKNKPDFIFSESFDANLKPLGTRLIVFPKDIFFRAGPRIVEGMKFMESLQLE